MYQIGISSSEKKLEPVAPLLRDEVSQPQATDPLNSQQTTKKHSEEEAFTKLFEADYVLEEDDSFRNKAILMSAGLLGLAIAGYFIMPSSEAPQKVAKAEKVEVSTQEVASFEPRPVKTTKLKNGRLLGVKTNNSPSIDNIITGSVPKSTPAKKATKVAKRDSENELTYVVKSGDTLYKIARQFGTSVKEIVEDNNISDPTKLKLKTKLVIR